MRAVHRVLRQVILGEKIVWRDNQPTAPLVQATHGWVVAYEVGGKPVKYFRWDRDEVWKWTKTMNMAAVFPTEDVASRQMKNCDISWKYQYKINKVAL